MTHIATAQSSRGYIALMTVVIVSAILLGLTTTVASTGFFSRGNSLNTEFKRVSLGLAESCMNKALLELAKNDDYDGDETVDINGDECYIEPIPSQSYNPTTHRKTIVIATSAKYPDENSAYSRVETGVTLLDPEAVLVDQPAACNLVASPSPILPGKIVTVQWTTSSNADAFKLNDWNGAEVGGLTVPSDSRTYTIPTNQGQGDISFTGTATDTLGGSGICTATVTVAPPPPTPSCADTVMILDRSGSLTTTDLANERNAATSLLNLYATLTPFPKIGVGSFGGLSGGAASIPTNGQLGKTQANIQSTINSITGSNSSVGSDLAAAINAGRTELTSARATPGNPKVLIFVSDGEPSRPTGNVSSDTQSALNAADAAKLAGIQIFTVRYSQDISTAGRTLMAQLASGNVPVAGHQPGTTDSSGSSPTATGAKYPLATHSPNGTWTNAGFGTNTPDDAYATNATAGNQQGWGSFGLSLTGASSITGIEVQVEGKTTAGGANLWPTGDSSFGSASLDDIANWDETGSDNVNTNNPNASNNDTDPTTKAIAGGVGNDSASPDTGAFAKIAAGEWICHSVNAGAVTNPTLRYYFRGDPDAVDNENMAVEYRSGGTCTSTTGWTSVRTNELDDTNNNVDEGWSSQQSATLPNGLVGFVRFRNLASGANKFARVDGATLSSSGGVAGTCQVGVALSWNNGTSWTAAKNVTLSGTEALLNPAGNSSIDLWGRTWSAGEFSNGNFAVRLSNVNCTGSATANIDGMSVNVRYTGYNPSAENTDGDNYFISPLTSDDMEEIFETIGAKVCPAAAPACSNTIDDDGDGFTDGNDSGCSSPSDNDEWTVPPLPDPPVPPPPPPPITVGPWQQD